MGHVATDRILFRRRQCVSVSHATRRIRREITVAKGSLVRRACFRGSIRLPSRNGKPGRSLRPQYRGSAHHPPSCFLIADHRSRIGKTAASSSAGNENTIRSMPISSQKRSCVRSSGHYLKYRDWQVRGISSCFFQLTVPEFTDQNPNSVLGRKRSALGIQPLPYVRWRAERRREMPLQQ